MPGKQPVIEKEQVNFTGEDEKIETPADFVTLGK